MIIMTMLTVMQPRVRGESVDHNGEKGCLRTVKNAPHLLLNMIVLTVECPSVQVISNVCYS